MKVAIDWKAAGLDPKQVTAINAETGEPVTLAGGGFTTAVLQRDFVPVLIAPQGADAAPAAPAAAGGARKAP